jgi:hypothetical protein
VLVSVNVTSPGAVRAVGVRKDLQTLRDRSARLVARLADLTRRVDDLQHQITAHLNR